MTPDPYGLLGVSPGATIAELAAARRRAAQLLHPDHGGDQAAMQAVNAAYAEAVRRASEPATALPEPPLAPRAGSQHVRSAGRRRLQGLQQDFPSFTIDVLPAEAFEALLIVTTWIGEALVDDPPYVLEVFLHEPSPCWCRLDLVPDAGGTTVSLTVAAVEGEERPDIDAVRDVWVANLNTLGDG
jgi:hypothetical protein